MPPIWQRGTNLQYPSSRSGFEPGIRQVKIPKKREVPGLNRSWVALFSPHKNLLVHYLYWFTLLYYMVEAQKRKNWTQEADPRWTLRGKYTQAFLCGFLKHFNVRVIQKPEFWGFWPEFWQLFLSFGKPLFTERPAKASETWVLQKKLSEFWWKPEFLSDLSFGPNAQKKAWNMVNCHIERRVVLRANYP